MDTMYFLRQFKQKVVDVLSVDDPEIEQMMEEIINSHDYEAPKQTAPGIQLVLFFDPVVRKVMKTFKEHNKDCQFMAHALTIGVLQASRSVEEEAHQTLELLAKCFVQSAVAAEEDVGKTVRGFVEGVVESAKGGRLNGETAASIAATACVREAKRVSKQCEQTVRRALMEKVMNVHIKIYKRIPRKKSSIHDVSDEQEVLRRRSELSDVLSHT